ncbi:glutaredoxin 3 [Rhodoferax sp. 4810]|uniref:Glutaredoxin n=1 Tax=Thiospirillum jenense TaxID=1653858 RepID=A0A839H728_9GAMM|nr:glutaredoxin 3 [Thiospirillum jenense]MBB1073199.1 glutaredoxin 3 [Rhodoferax jenense]MBB1124640.1 glutaredoxin 3 [Thiospirillum jenense]
MVKVEMYSTAWCPYCIRARHLLKQKGVDYTEIRIDLNPEQHAMMIQRSTCFTVPQIFINDRPIGGYDDLTQLDALGQLNQLLQAAESGTL